jgi:hypothetical protein
MRLMRIASARRAREPNLPPDHNPVAFPQGPTAPQEPMGTLAPVKASPGPLCVGHGLPCATACNSTWSRRRIEHRHG